MPRSRSETCIRGAAALCSAALVQCSLLFDLSGLESSSSTLDDSSVSGGGRVAAPAIARDAGGGATEDAQGPSSTGPVSWGDGPSIDAPVGAAASSDDAEGGADAPFDSHAPCVTSFSPASTVLFDFSTSDALGWAATSNGPPATLGWTAGDGHTCPGALTTSVGFSAYDGVPASVDYSYGSGGSWSGTKLHCWIKIQSLADGGAADYRGLYSIDLHVHSNSWMNFSFLLEYVNPTFGDGQWHEMVIDLAVPDGGQVGQAGRNSTPVVTESVQRFGVTIWPFSSRPQGAPASPPPVTVLLDDVWLE